MIKNLQIQKTLNFGLSQKLIFVLNIINLNKWILNQINIYSILAIYSIFYIKAATDKLFNFFREFK